jgi:hypothetical protein
MLNSSVKYFGNLFDVGATPAIGLTHTVPCQLLYNGQSIFTGKLYVDSIVTGENHAVIYNCVTVDTTIDFRTRVDNRALADLDWSAYNHDYTWTNISSSWNDDLLGGAILYPLAQSTKRESEILDALCVKFSIVSDAVFLILFTKFSA